MVVIEYSLGSSNILLGVHITFSAMVCGVLFVAFGVGWYGPLGRAGAVLAGSHVAHRFSFHCVIYPQPFCSMEIPKT